jgi:hypothetical protein
LLEAAISTDYNYPMLRNIENIIKNIMLQHVNKSKYFSDNSKGGKCLKTQD